MKKQLRLVFELNQLDLKIHEVQDRLERIPVRRQELETGLAGQKALLSEKTTKMEGLESVRRDKEGDVALSEARLKEFQGKLSLIKTNKEYQAAVKGVSETKKSNKVLEDQILERMTEIETLRKEKEELDGSLQALVGTTEKEKIDLDQEEKRLQGAALEVEEERKKILTVVEATVLGQYQKVKKMRRDAVTFIENGTCQGCNMRIQPQLIIEIQKSKSIHSCPSCHRILYLREWQEGSQKGNGEVVP